MIGEVLQIDMERKQIGDGCPWSQRDNLNRLVAVKVLRSSMPMTGAFERFHRDSSGCQLVPSQCGQCL